MYTFKLINGFLIIEKDNLPCVAIKEKTIHSFFIDQYGTEKSSCSITIEYGFDRFEDPFGFNFENQEQVQEAYKQLVELLAGQEQPNKFLNCDICEHWEESCEDCNGEDYVEVKG